ncbi:phosphatidylinositol 3,4,5-trisphosphate 3-phosphatase TPTE2-like isoform 9-T12 [Liasis olivaceus]
MTAVNRESEGSHRNQSTKKPTEEDCNADTCTKKELTKESIVSLDDGVDEEDSDSDSWTSKIKKTVSPCVMSFGFRFFGLVLIFVDITLVILSLLIGDTYESVEYTIGNISLSIALFFFIDVILRVFIEGFKKYFHSKLNILDSIIVVGTLLVDIVYISSDLGGITLIPRTVIIFRMLRVIILIRIFRLASETERLEKVARRMVSENKRRYTKGGFDLDLTYVTARVIAMSFPSSGQQAFYRNPIREVAKFLDTKHEDHYKVYNLCSEQGYDPQFFHYRVERMFIDDHNVPTLAETLKFTANVRQWMEQDNHNVVAIHCKGGKGVGKGNGTDFRIKIIMEKEVAFQCICATQANCKLFLDHENDLVVIGLKNCPVIRNDVKVRFEANSDIPKGYDGCAFFFWFHTAFIQDYQLYLPRNEIDNLNKPKMWKMFRENFAVELNFTDP